MTTPTSSTDPGLHLAALCDTDEGFLDAVVPFVRDGLLRRERVVCVVASGTASRIMARLVDSGIDAAAAESAGQLEQQEPARNAPGSPGSDADVVQTALRLTQERAEAAGFDGLRLAIDAAAAMHDAVADTARLLRLESRLNDHIAGIRCQALCVYDRRRVGPEILLEVLRTHPRVFIGSTVCANPHFVAPAALHGAGHASDQLDAWLSGLRERQDTLEALGDVRLRLERIIEGTGAGTWETNLQTGEGEVNERWAEILGYTLEELGGTGTAGAESFRTLAHPDDLARADQELARHLSGAIPDYRCEIRMRHRAGHWVWIESRGRLLQRTEDGRPLLVYGMHTDISDRRRAQEELLVVHGRIRQFVDANIVGIAISGPDGEIIDANDYYLDTLGFSRDDLEHGRVDWRSATPPEWSRADDAALREVAERGASSAFEKEYLHRDGRRVPVTLATAAIPGDPPGMATFVLDISRQKAAEDALRRSQERYRQLFDAASDPVFLVDRETLAIVDANELASTLYGYTHQELLERTSLDLSAEPEATTQFVHQPDGWPGERPLVDTRLHRRKDGTVFPVEVSDRTLEMEGRSVLFVSCRDITDRLAAERTIRQLAAAMDSAPSGMTVHDPTGLIVYANAMAARMHGYTRAEMLAIDPERIESPGDAAKIPARIGEVRSRGAQTYQVEHLRKDGSILPLSVTVSRVTWDGHDGLLAVSTDITERLAAERAIREAAVELEAAQRVAHVGSWTWDPASGQITWSTEVFRIFGFEPAASAPTLEEQADLHPGASRARLLETLASAARTGAAYEIDHDIVRRDGELRHLSERGEAVRDASGAIIKLRGTIADVTELRQAQALVDQAQRTEMVGRLAGGIAHDFNNLLTAIGGYAELLGSSFRPDDPRNADVAAISEATARAAGLTRQLLAFGRRETLRPTRVHPDAVITGLSSMVRSLIPADIAVQVVRGAGDATVLVERDRLEQELVNLVINASDAMPRGGTLTIETATERVEAGDRRLRATTEPGAYVRLTVTDTGTGIVPEVLPHIFEPFYTTKPMWQGSGLGLSSVDGFVDQSGGFLAVDTEVGRGSSFSIFLLRSDGLAAAGEPEGPVILVVDDEPGVRGITVRMLQELGYPVIEAADAAQALAAFDGGSRVDLLVADVVLPGMTGRELARRCVLAQPHLPVLLISGYPAEAQAGPTDDGVAPAFLAKPFSMEALGVQVRRLLARDA